MMDNYLLLTCQS